MPAKFEAFHCEYMDFLWEPKEINSPASMDSFGKLGDLPVTCDLDLGGGEGLGQEPDSGHAKRVDFFL